MIETRITQMIRVLTVISVLISFICVIRVSIFSKFAVFDFCLRKKNIC